MTRRKRKTPEQIAHERAEMEERAREVIRLRSQPDVHVVHDQAFRIRGAFRMDWVALLHQRETLSTEEANAVRRLEADICESHGLGMNREEWTVVDGTPTWPPGQGLSQRMVDASARVENVLSRIDPDRRALLKALLDPFNPGAGSTQGWRGTTRRLTGHLHKAAQTAAVVGAVRALEGAYLR